MTQTIIEELFEHVKERYEELFNIRKDWERVMNRFKYICFLGQVDKNDLYISMLHQVINARTGRIKNLTLAEADEYHLTGNITGLSNFRPFAWTFWRIDMTTGYISVFTSFRGSPRHGPKDNYAAAFHQIRLYKRQQLHWETMLHRMRPIDQIVLKKFIDIVEFSKTNYVKFADFDKKVFYDMSKYFGIINNKGLVADPWFETMRPELIRLPVKHNLVLIRKDVEMTNLLRGPSFATIDYVNNAVIRKFDRFKDLHDFMYSLIDFINRNPKQLKLKQRIINIQKHWRSNRWPMTSSTEEREARNEEINKIGQDVKSLNRRFNKIELESDYNMTDNISKDFNQLMDLKMRVISMQEVLNITDDRIHKLGSKDKEPTIENNEFILSKLREKLPSVNSSWNDLDTNGRPREDEAEVKYHKELLTKYEIAVTKFMGRIAIRADIWEHGISYFLTNFNEGPDPWGERLFGSQKKQGDEPCCENYPDCECDDDIGDDDYVLKPDIDDDEEDDDDCIKQDKEDQNFHDRLTVRDQLTWNRAIAEIRAGGNNRRYLVEVQDNFRLNINNNDNFTFPNTQNLTIELRGHNRTIDLICCCRVFTLRASQHVILNNIIFAGKRNDQAAATSPPCNVPFYLTRGTITLRGNTEIKDCLNGAIYCDGGVVIMEQESSIHHNVARNGGGIYFKAGALTMRDFATIYCNTATERGGGVFFIQGALNVRHNSRIFGTDVCGRANQAPHGAAVFGYTHTSELTIPSIPRQCMCGNCPICNPPVKPLPPPVYPDPEDPPGWPDPEFTVTFVGNGGHPNPQLQVVTQNKKITEPSEMKNKDLVLEGWYTDIELTKRWNFDTMVVKRNMTLYAKWEEAVEEIIEFSVRFAANGGEPVPADTKVVKGCKIMEPLEMTKGNLRFAGWFKDPFFNDFWDWDLGVTEDTILYAKWENDPDYVPPVTEKFTITFNSNGGNLISSQQVELNGKIEMPTNLIRTGFVFDGWYRDNNEWKFKWDFHFNTVKGEMTLYAKWIEAAIADKETWEYNFQSSVSDPQSRFVYLKDIPGFNREIHEDWFEQHMNVIEIWVTGDGGRRDFVDTPTQPAQRIPNIWFEEPITQAGGTFAQQFGGFDYIHQHGIIEFISGSQVRMLQIRKVR